MPLNRPALVLGTGPRVVADARRWTIDSVRELGREDLLECAEVGVSELVTNALLHGLPPIEVRVRGTREHPRIEVADASMEAPTLPEPAPQPTLDLDDLDALDLDGADFGDLDGLLTFGRGLSIVARAADVWGADIEEGGKTVWFAPATHLQDDAGPQGLVTRAPGVDEHGHGTSDLPPDPTEFTLLGVPVRAYTTFQNHFKELRREVRLLAMAHQADYPLARDLAEVFDRLGRPLTLGVGSTDVRRAQERGEATADMRVLMSRAAAGDVGRFIELLDLTDAFCRAEKMLSLARSPEQVAFQTWYLGEFVRQVEGGGPRAWDPAVVESAGGSRASGGTSSARPAAAW